jgi:hypothetical protein
LVWPKEPCKVKQRFTKHVGSNSGRLAGIYTVICYINPFDRKDLTLVDSHEV